MQFSFGILVVASIIVITTSHAINHTSSLEVRGWPKDNNNNAQSERDWQQRQKEIQRQNCERQLAWAERELIIAMNYLFDAIQAGSNPHRLQAAQEAVKNFEREVSQLNNELSRLQ